MVAVITDKNKIFIILKSLQWHVEFHKIIQSLNLILKIDIKTLKAHLFIHHLWWIPWSSCDQYNISVNFKSLHLNFY